MKRTALLLLLALMACSAQRDPNVPNIVLVIGDDHGWPDFGFMGSPIVRTPRLDELAASGVTFTQGYNPTSLCRPSLRGLLTGLHPYEWYHRVQELAAQGVKRRPSEWMREFPTLPGLLAERGYASFQSGKFWEADYEVAGFTDGMQPPGEDSDHGGAGRFVGRDGMEPVFEFIDAHREQPFFLWFAPMLPHTPHDAPRELRAPYLKAGVSAAAAAYYANITRFDSVLGQLLDHLEQRELRENTLVVYLSDNGWDQLPQSRRGGMLGGPRGKRTAYELGARTPILVSWPGVTPVGMRSDALVSTLDLFPTLLDYAGGGAGPPRLGHSLRPTLQEGAVWERTSVVGWLYQTRVVGLPVQRRPDFRERSFFLRRGPWWLIWYQDRDIEELFDADADPRAERDLASQKPEVAAGLKREVVDWAAHVRGQEPAAPPVPTR